MRWSNGSKWLVAACLSALACAHAPTPAPTPPVTEKAIAPVELPARPLLRPDSAPRPPMLRLLEATHVTLEVRDADLRSLLLGLGRDAALDVVVDPDVEGRVTADLREVSLREILDELVLARGYAYRLSGRVLRISSPAIVTRIYRIDYPSIKREASAELSIGGFIGAAPSVTEDGASTESQDSSTSSIVTSETYDFWAELDETLRSIVFGSTDGAGGEDAGTGEERPAVRISRQAGIAVVSASPAVLERVERYLDEMDRTLAKQVMIDAKVLEITLGDTLDLGIDFEGAPKLGSMVGLFTRALVPGLREATIAQSLAPLLETGGFRFGLANDDFGILLNALAQQTDVRVVSTPRISTLNNHKALIKVVRNEVFFVAEVETVITDTVVQQLTEFKPKVVPVGVTLDVTPQVSTDSQITMHVRPSVSEIVSVEPQPTSDPDLPQTGSLPVVDLREADSVVRVSDGATMVIGGLVRSREFEQERRVPFFGDIPLLGNLFTRRETEERRTELVIFLTPTVLDRPSIARATDRVTSDFSRLEDLRRARSLGFPWWRQPLGESYGVRP